MTENLKIRQMWNKTTTIKNLKNCFENSVSGGSSVGRDGMRPGVFKADLSQKIRVLSRSVRQGKHRFSPYKQVLISKGAGKTPREISLPAVRDRVILRAMAEFLNEVDSRCSVELAQSAISRVIRALESRKYNYYIKLDIKNFYPSVNHSWLESRLCETLKYRKLVDFYMSAVRTPTAAMGESIDSRKILKGIPQGLAISNGLAELAMRHVDELFLENADIKLFRYVDDILILLKDDNITNTLSYLDIELSRAGLDRHRGEPGAQKFSSGEISSEFDFLGYKFSWPRVSVRKSSIVNVETSIIRIFTGYKYGLLKVEKSEISRIACERRLLWRLNLTISGCVFEGSRYGWLSYYSQIRHQQLLRHLDALVDRQLNKFNLSHLSPKKFTESYRFAASRKIDDTGFVPNFDVMDSAQRSSILEEGFFVDIAGEGADSAKISSIFDSKMRRVVAELEKDVQGDRGGY